MVNARRHTTFKYRHFWKKKLSILSLTALSKMSAPIQGAIMLFQDTSASRQLLQLDTCRMHLISDL